MNTKEEDTDKAFAAWTNGPSPCETPTMPATLSNASEEVDKSPVGQVLDGMQGSSICKSAFENNEMSTVDDSMALAKDDVKEMGIVAGPGNQSNAWIANKKIIGRAKEEKTKRHRSM